MRDLAPIGALANVTLGKMLQPARKNDADELRPYLRAAHVQPFGRLDLNVAEKHMWFSEKDAETLTLRAGDAVIVEGGAGFGRAAFLTQDLAGWGFQNSIIRLRSDSSDMRFLVYALSSALDSGEIGIACNAATFAHFTAEKVEAFRVPHFSLDDQKRIADYLDRETGEIDAMLGKLDELVIDVRSRLVGETHRVLSRWFGYSTQPIWSVMRPVKELNHPDEAVLSVYRDYGVILKSSRDDNHNRTPENLMTYQLVKPGDVVINKMKAWQGSLGVSGHRGIVSPDYQVARPVQGLDSRYLHAVLRSRAMIPQYKARSTGVRPSQWRLYWNDFASLRIPVPQAEEQKRIADHLDEVTGKIDAMLAKAAELKALLLERRGALITDVVTGRKEIT
jgi:type I restriction enzyme S subunit